MTIAADATEAGKLWQRLKLNYRRSGKRHVMYHLHSWDNKHQT